MNQLSNKLFFSFLFYLFFVGKLYVALVLVPQNWVCSPYKFLKMFTPDFLVLFYPSVGYFVDQHIRTWQVIMLSLFLWIGFFGYSSFYLWNWWLIQSAIYMMCFYGCYYFQSRGIRPLKALIYSFWAVTLMSFMWELPFAIQRGEPLTAPSYFYVTYGLALFSLTEFLLFQPRKTMMAYVIGTFSYLAVWVLAFSGLPFYQTIFNPLRLGTFLSFVGRLLTTIPFVLLSYRVKTVE